MIQGPLAGIASATLRINIHGPLPVVLTEYTAKWEGLVRLHLHGLPELTPKAQKQFSQSTISVSYVQEAHT